MGVGAAGKSIILFPGGDGSLLAILSDFFSHQHLKMSFTCYDVHWFEQNLALFSDYKVSSSHHCDSRISTTHAYVTCSLAPPSLLLDSPSSRQTLSSFCQDSGHFVQTDQPNVFTIGFFHLAWYCPGLSMLLLGSVLDNFLWMDDSPQHGTFGMFPLWGYNKFGGV